MPGAFTLAQASIFRVLWRLIAARVYVNPGLGVLDLLPAHQVVLVKVLANVDQVIGLIETVDVDDLHAQLPHDVILWLRVECYALAHRQIVGDAALELIVYHEVYEQVQLYTVMVGGCHFSTLRWRRSDPGQHYRQVAVRRSWLNY